MLGLNFMDMNRSSDEEGEEIDYVFIYFYRQMWAILKSSIAFMSGESCGS